MNQLSEATILQHAVRRSFERGLDCYDQGAVVSLVRRGETIRGEVEGSAVQPYSVTATFTPSGDIQAECDCPYDVVARVVEAATPTLPREVIPICKRQAEAIMDAGKADRYHHAAHWVERARNAYRAAGQEPEWQSYKAHLLATHQRKYKLVPMLRDL